MHVLFGKCCLELWIILWCVCLMHRGLFQNFPFGVALGVGNAVGLGSMGGSHGGRVLGGSTGISSNNLPNSNHGNSPVSMPSAARGSSASQPSPAQTRGPQTPARESPAPSGRGRQVPTRGGPAPNRGRSNNTKNSKDKKERPVTPVFVWVVRCKLSLALAWLSGKPSLSHPCCVMFVCSYICHLGLH